jgi:hypothetical protein
VSVRDKKKIGGSKGLPVIKCSVCGKEILLVPNVKLMSASIEAHVETHKVNAVGKKASVEEIEHIRDDLIKQVLDKAAKKDI